MLDILERLTPAHIAEHPMALQEAIDTIKMLRADNERAERWIRILQDMLATQARADNERKSGTG